jgi:hypothetical protein
MYFVGQFTEDMKNIKITITVVMNRPRNRAAPFPHTS